MEQPRLLLFFARLFLHRLPCTPGTMSTPNEAWAKFERSLLKPSA
jgi:hypothetical protein